MTRLIVYNIEYLEGLKGEKFGYLEFWRRIFHPSKIKNRLINGLKNFNPEIVAFLEVGGGSFLEKDYLYDIEKQLEMKYRMKRTKYHFTGPLKLLNELPLLGKQSNAIISKKKIEKHEVLFLKEGVKKAVIKAEFSDPKFTLFLVHLSLGEKTRKKQILELIRFIKKTKGPVILAGDFNTFDGEREVEKLLKETAFDHKFKITGGRIFTYPTFHPRRRFDYILTSKEINIKNYKVLDLDISDHLPVMVDFEVKK